MKSNKSIHDDISKIEIKIHRFRLSGQYIWSDLDGIIGKLKVNDKYRRSKRMPKYAKQAFVRFRNRNLTVFLNPISGAIPLCVIELSYPYQVLLSDLRSKLPELNVSRAEYTIDIFFNDPKDVKKYFSLIYRSIYFPNQKQIVLHSDNELDDAIRSKNAWVYTDKMKLYERGPDDLIKNGGYWLLDDVDRIRIELKAKWRDLYPYGLNHLKLFSKNPKFYLMLKHRFGFKRFKKSLHKISDEDECYYAKDSEGHSGAFQNQYLYLKEHKSVNNISRSIEDVPELLPLYYRILSKIQKREHKWEEKYRMVNNEGISKEDELKKRTGWTTISIGEAKHEQMKDYFNSK